MFGRIFAMRSYIEGSQKAHLDPTYRYELPEITGELETPTGMFLLLLSIKGSTDYHIYVPYLKSQLQIVFLQIKELR